MLRERLDKAEPDALEMIRTMYKENRFIPVLIHGPNLVTIEAEEKDYAVCASDYDRREYSKEGHRINEFPMQELLPDIKEKTDLAGIAITFLIENDMPVGFLFTWDEIGV